MAETEEGGRGEESRGGSGYGKRTLSQNMMTFLMIQLKVD